MKKGYFFILIATIAFSSMEVVLKLIAGEVNPVQLTLARFSIGFVFLAPVAVYTLKKRSKRLDRKSVAYFALLGLIGIAICMPIYQMSINFTESSVVAVLFSCNPVFVTFFAFMILKEPIKRRHLAALSLEILGTLAIINPMHIKLNMVGVGLALCAVHIRGIPLRPCGTKNLRSQHHPQRFAGRVSDLLPLVIEMDVVVPIWDRVIQCGDRFWISIPICTISGL